MDTHHNRGGVMGWLNTARSNGIVFQVVPGGSQPGFQVATVDFLAEDPNVNETPPTCTS
jgi:hypothetical protein